VPSSSAFLFIALPASLVDLSMLRGAGEGVRREAAAEWQCEAIRRRLGSGRRCGGLRAEWGD
jgi:hypothetical protein